MDHNNSLVTSIVQIVAMCTLLSLHILCSKRVQTLYEFGSPRISSVMRFLVLVWLLFVIDASAFYYFVTSVNPKKANSHGVFAVIMAAQCLDFLVSVWTTMAELAVHAIENRLSRAAAQRRQASVFGDKQGFLLIVKSIMSFLDIGCSGLILGMFLPFYTKSMIIALHAIIDLIQKFIKSIQSLDKLLVYRRLVKSLNHLPDATEEEVIAVETCLICRDDLPKPAPINSVGAIQNAKKLSCSHIFHSSCIRSWAAQQATCPTCRTPIKPPTEPIIAPSSPVEVTPTNPLIVGENFIGNPDFNDERTLEEFVASVSPRNNNANSEVGSEDNILSSQSAMSPSASPVANPDIARLDAMFHHQQQLQKQSNRTVGFKNVSSLPASPTNNINFSSNNFPQISSASEQKVPISSSTSVFLNDSIQTGHQINTPVNYNYSPFNNNYAMYNHQREEDTSSSRFPIPQLSVDFTPNIDFINSSLFPQLSMLCGIDHEKGISLLSPSLNGLDIHNSTATSATNEIRSIANIAAATPKIIIFAKEKLKEHFSNNKSTQRSKSLQTLINVASSPLPHPLATNLETAEELVRLYFQHEMMLVSQSNIMNMSLIFEGLPVPIGSNLPPWQINALGFDPAVKTALLQKVRSFPNIPDVPSVPTKLIDILAELCGTLWQSTIKDNFKSYLEKSLRDKLTSMNKTASNENLSSFSAPVVKPVSPANITQEPRTCFPSVLVPNVFAPNLHHRNEKTSEERQLPILLGLGTKKVASDEHECMTRDENGQSLLLNADGDLNASVESDADDRDGINIEYLSSSIKNDDDEDNHLKEWREKQAQRFRLSQSADFLNSTSQKGVVDFEKNHKDFTSRLSISASATSGEFNEFHSGKLRQRKIMGDNEDNKHSSDQRRNSRDQLEEENPKYRKEIFGGGEGFTF